jgi:hypothetical protein
VQIDYNEVDPLKEYSHGNKWLNKIIIFSIHYLHNSLSVSGLSQGFSPKFNPMRIMYDPIKDASATVFSPMTSCQ